MRFPAQIPSPSVEVGRGGPKAFLAAENGESVDCCHSNINVFALTPAHDRHPTSPSVRDPSRPFAALAAHEDPGLSHPGHGARRARQRDAARPAPTKGRRLASSDLHPFEARIATTREGTKLQAGALLAREWNGRLERVMILDQGVAWNGETYGSLSQVAKAMTGTSWNGHRFFGLRTARSERSGMVHRRSRVCEAASSDAASTPIKDGGAAFARRPSQQAASP
jgi:Protein of unknown function (DUF2924)